jgi:hypothetical protein
MAAILHLLMILSVASYISGAPHTQQNAKTNELDELDEVSKFFNSLLKNFPAVMVTGYPDEGIDPVDPYNCTGSCTVTSTINIDSDDGSYITIVLRDGVLVGESGYTPPKADIHQPDDNEYKIIYEFSTGSLTYSGMYELSGKLGENWVEDKGEFLLNATSIDRDISQLFSTATGEYALYDMTETDTLYGGAMAFNTLPDNVAEVVAQNREEILSQVFNSIQNSYINAEFALMAAYTINKQDK